VSRRMGGASNRALRLGISSARHLWLQPQSACRFSNSCREARNLGGGRSEGGGQCVFTSGRLCGMLIGRCCHFLELAMSKKQF
jgi:hypothetical protein